MNDDYRHRAFLERMKLSLEQREQARAKRVQEEVAAYLSDPPSNITGDQREWYERKQREFTEAQERVKQFLLTTYEVEEINQDLVYLLETG